MMMYVTHYLSNHAVIQYSGIFVDHVLIMMVKFYYGSKDLDKLEQEKYFIINITRFLLTRSF